MSLEKIQNDLIEYLYTLEPAEEKQARVRAYFLDPQYPDPHNGLKVYRGNLVFGLISAMQETYTMTKDLLGMRNFNFFCRAFLYQNPSTNSDLIQYGEGFGEFLAGRPEISHIAFIADLARLEWALERVFYAKPETSFLGEVPADWRTVSPQLKGSVRSLSTSYRVHEAWLAFMNKGEEGLNPEMFKKEPEYLVAWSDEGRPRVTPVNQVMARWVEGVLAGSTPDMLAQQGMTQDQVLESYRFALRQGWISQK